MNVNTTSKEPKTTPAGCCDECNCNAICFGPDSWSMIIAFWFIHAQCLTTIAVYRICVGCCDCGSVYNRYIFTKQGNIKTTSHWCFFSESNNKISTKNTRTTKKEKKNRRGFAYHRHTYILVYL